MRRSFCAGMLFAACTAVCLATPATAQESEIQAVFSQLAAGGDETATVGDTDIELASCDSCGPADLDLGSFGNGCTGQFYAGAEYLYVRPTFSQALAFVTQDISDPAAPVITYTNFDFEYTSNYRLYGGYRVCECGCDVRFTYTDLSSDSSFQSPTASTAGGISVFSPLEVFGNIDGSSISGSATIDLDTFDLAFSKTIPLGSPLCCDSGCGGCGDGGCSDSCGCGCGCWCPAWDITWSGGVRVVDYDSSFLYDSFIPDQGTVPGTTLDQTSIARTSFSGAGLRTGLTGRRYFGKSGFASIFLRGDISLVLGDLDIVAESVDGNNFSTHRFSNTQIIPITEIEAGGSLLLTRNISVSAGYLFAAYHDLGYRAEYPFDTQPTGVQLDNFDDANILGWDGFFVRGEIAF